MTDSASQSARLLQEEFGDRAALPGSAAYSGALDRVFFPDAARRRPACVVEPASAGDVSSIMKIAQKTGCSVTVRGGGLSSNCVSDGAVMVDLSAHMDHAVADGDDVVVAGGATMGTVLDALAPQRRTVPIGIVRLAGLGLATRGGVGFLTRSLGLTVDHLLGRARASVRRRGAAVRRQHRSGRGTLVGGAGLCTELRRGDKGRIPHASGGASLRGPDGG